MLTQIWKPGTGSLLDIGCGDGFFTFAFGASYQRIVGIDIQQAYVETFNRHAPDQRFSAIEASASKMPFADSEFDDAISLESFEHIPEITEAAAECARVLKPKGRLLVTVPNRLFPFENHGIYWRGRRIGSRIPLLPWIPPLHRRFAQARVFTSRELRQIFEPQGFEFISQTWCWPTFEHGGNPFQKALLPLLPLMRACEKIPGLRCFGSSVAAVFVRQPSSPR